jgi:hypothetical protein
MFNKRQHLNINDLSWNPVGQTAIPIPTLYRDNKSKTMTYLMVIHSIVIPVSMVNSMNIQNIFWLKYYDDQYYGNER